MKPKPVRVLLDKKIPKKVEAIETDLDGNASISGLTGKITFQ